MGLMDGFARINGALTGKTQAPTSVAGPGLTTKGAIHTNQTKADTGSYDLLRAGKYAQMKRMGLNPDGTPIKANPMVSPRTATSILKQGVNQP